MFGANLHFKVPAQRLRKSAAELGPIDEID